MKISAGESYEPKRSDIAVFQNYEGGSEAGHVQIYTGKYWTSDNPQNTKGGENRSKDNNLGIGFFSNQKYKDNGQYVIYRNPKWVE